ncbi:hypothetical protein [Luteolibacter sp. LG18]|uniref:hypothetical protein n=1 Tax=Luteolibacter sp. LG18 TaxID=2819286 RepID=UPI002B2EED72|nr:hypothetical protein llg_08920 [Luteolibacter sp. LG18]
MSDVPPPTPAPVKKRGCLVPILVSIIVVLLVVIGAWWWVNRPIQPVQLSAQEKAAVEQKLEAVQAPARPTYEKGAKEIILTERELNGLLNENTQLGNTLKFELVKGAVHARYETDLDKDLPVVGGKRLKARARFFVSNDQGQPHLVLDDLTVWGISLPNDWLGGLKGHDLLGDTVGQGRRGGLAGVEDIQVEDGQIRIKLKE